MTETRHERDKRPPQRAADHGPAARREVRSARRQDGMRAARRAARQVQDLTGHEPENVVSVTRNDHGWQVGVEVTELHRIPDTTDIMAVYQVEIDTDGELISCKRGQRYHRGSTDTE
jgi:hypothetical protein